jgi:hypothetical protein
MVTATEYNKALKRLMELNNLYIVPGDREDLEQQHLVDLITQYEAEQDAEAKGEYDFMVEFEDRFLASQYR